eukprot:SAG11_NODE_26937_length_340_cov_0.629167_1_plen_39_part_10
MMRKVGKNFKLVSGWLSPGYKSVGKIIPNPRYALNLLHK